MSVSLTWTSSTASQGSGGLALVTGDTLTQTSWQGLVSNAYLLSQLAQGPGQLQYVSATQVKLKIVNGAVVRIAGTLYSLVSDITANNTSTYIDGVSGNLAASTLYYVYAFISSGTTVSLTFSQTAYTIDTTTGNYGTYIKSGQPGYTLVGMIRTNGSSQFVDSDTSRFVVSWFNRRTLVSQRTLTSDATSSSTSLFEISSADLRCEFLTWADEYAEAIFTTTMRNDTNASGASSAIGVDGTTYSGITAFSQESASSQFSNQVVRHAAKLAEGYHYCTALGKVGGGNETWFSSVGSLLTTGMQVRIRG